MSSILDHVEQAVPRATVYGAMKGSPVFIGKYFREINPASNATEYRYGGGERRITFVVASPDKTIFNDLRSAYLRFDIKEINDIIVWIVLIAVLMIKPDGLFGVEKVNKV